MPIDPNDPESLKAFSESLSRFTRSARATESEVSRLRDALIKARDSGADMGRTLSRAVSLYEKAIKSGSGETEKYKNIIRALREAAPEAFKRMGDAAERYAAITRRSFTDSITGSGAMADRVRDVIAGYKDLYKMQDDKARSAISARAGASGANAIYSAEGEMESIRQDLILRRAMKAEGLNTLAISRRIIESRDIERRKTKQASEETRASSIVNAKAAAASAQGMNNILGPGPLGAVASRIADSRGAVGSAIRSVMTSEAAAAKGVAPTLVAGVSSALIGSLAKTLGPLSASFSGIALVTRFITGIFEGIGDVSRVGGNQLRALGMNSKVSMGLFNASMMGSDASIRRFAGVANTSGALVRNVFDREILPAAQRGMLQFNTLDRSRATIDGWTGALAGAAVKGAAWGIPYEESVGRIIKLAKTFGNSHKATADGFSSIMVASKMASLTIEEVTNNLGDMEDIGRRLGAGGMSMFKEAGIRMSGAARPASGAQANMMMAGVAGLAADRFRLIGLLSASRGIRGGMEAYVGAHGGADSGARMFGTSLSAISDLYRGKSARVDGMSPMAALESKDAMQRFRASELVGGLMNISPEAFLDRSFKKSFDAFTADPTTEGRRKLEAEARRISGDLTQEGLDSMKQQVGVLNLIYNSVDNIAKNFASLLGGPIARIAVGNVVQRTNAERMATQPERGVRE